ncbi:MAG: NADPH:quinone oxidoreductase family protein [Ectothiorhodospiraceae bacterium]|nr:NADPH:quinone oxidoreductase family protein [Ectothiorhodospiraceae bacterium]
MKAVLCREYGAPDALSFEEIPELQPAPGQVVVSVHACAVNFPDTLIIQGKYQFKPEMPFAPGGEVAGVIKAVGEGVDGYAVGDRVIAIPGWGGFSEEVAVRPEKLIPLPDGIPMDEAAALVITYGTTHYGLKDRGAIQPGETLLVLGAAGGTGVAAIELGKVLGARVIAAASSEEKLAFCRQHGADDTINYVEEDLRERLRQLTDNKGVDVVYDPVGGPYTEPALRSLGWKGRLLVIGFTAGDIPRPPLNLPLLKGASIVGVFYGAFQQQEPERYRALMAELLEWVREGRVRPSITARYPLDQAPRALQDILDRRVTGKVVVQTDAGLGASR